MPTPKDNLRVLREAQGLSLRELAYFSDCTHTAIREIERGTWEPSASLKGRLARALGVSVEKLWAPPERSEAERLFIEAEKLFADARAQLSHEDYQKFLDEILASTGNGS